MPPKNATPIIVPGSRLVTNTGCSLISGTPRPASQATNMPIKTTASIFQLIKPAKPGNWILPDTSGLSTPMVSRMMPA